MTSRNEEFYRWCQTAGKKKIAEAQTAKEK